jgi:hypothetical protein
MLERPATLGAARARRQANREHQRRSRRRRKAGRVVLRIEVDEFRLIDSLLAAHRLTEADGLDRRRVEAAVSRLLADWVTRWASALTFPGPRLPD